MYDYRKIAKDLYWVGASDRRLALFENMYPIPRGVSYNAYVLLDEKSVLLDTVDRSVADQFQQNLSAVLNGRPLDYVIVNHMEPDHCATLIDVLRMHPETTVMCTAKSATMIAQFFDLDVSGRIVTVKEGDTLSTGAHTFAFVMAPMVHWPEVMVSFDTSTGTLFSADAFGTFGALNGNLFADQVNFERDWLDDARRYYTNIVGKYGPQVQAVLKKAATLEIQTICPLHGPIWRNNLGWLLEKYDKWSSYTPEDNAVMIVYGSVYGHTENAANILAGMLAEKGVNDIRMYDVSVTHSSEILAEAFRVSHIVFASSTFNMGIFTPMHDLIYDLVAHNLQNRVIGLVQNGSWAPSSLKLMKESLSACRNMVLTAPEITIKSALKQEQLTELQALADALAATLPKAAEVIHGEVDNAAMFKLSYGLFVLTANDDDKDNGCIINTVSQVTSNPKRVTFAVNKANHTHYLILRNHRCNISILSEEATFPLFQRFGFSSGRDTDKFAGYTEYAYASNGIPYITEAANAMMSLHIVSAEDMGTHTLFVADVTEAKVLSAVPSVTYQYYFDHIKPKPQPKKASEPAKKKWVCKICGYEYEGDELPADYVCPLCKHPAEDFELVEAPAEPPKKKKWVCKICGYEYEGDELPADYVCPLCKHPAEDFELVEE
ncbi:MAG: flavin reductase [Clostridia bacterium]|nr:flavin reductase [Clostridia bacterium]